MVYSFSSDLAKLFGINEATFLQILYDVILRNRNLCIEDGGKLKLRICAVLVSNKHQGSEQRCLEPFLFLKNSCGI